MNILLINVPSRKGKGGFSLPLGLLYAASIIKRCGHKPKIFDPYLDDPELQDFQLNDFNRLDELISEHKPEIVGFGGIATSYGRTKQLSCYIKNKYPHIFQIAGGALSSVYPLLLVKTKIDLIFHGETEVSLPVFLNKFSSQDRFCDIEGVSFSKNGEVLRSKDPAQVTNLDSIPFPDYSLVDLRRYLHSIEDWIDAYRIYELDNGGFLSKLGDKKYYLPMVTSRGCTHKCLFCYRHMRGVRQHSVDYVCRHIEYLKQSFGISGFQFCDELFNSRPKWVMEFCLALEKNNLDIFYLIGGARVDKINESMLRRLKETGCIEINYGHESGSDAILKEYAKGVTVRQNREITLLTKEIGLNCPIQLVIGSPSENTKTIRETIGFLNNVNAYAVSLNYLIPLPGTPIWEYVEDNALIANVEEYLDAVASGQALCPVNLTKMPDKIWNDWQYLIAIARKLNYLKREKTLTSSFSYLVLLTVNKVCPLLLLELFKSKVRLRSRSEEKTIHICMPKLSLIGLWAVSRSAMAKRKVLHYEFLPLYLKGLVKFLSIPRKRIESVLGILFGLSVCEIKHPENSAQYRDLHLNMQETASAIAVELIPRLEQSIWIRQMGKIIGRAPALAYSIKEIVTRQIFAQVLSFSSCRHSLSEDAQIILVLDHRWPRDWLPVIKNNIKGGHFDFFIWPDGPNFISNFIFSLLIIPKLCARTVLFILERGVSLKNIKPKRYKVITEFIDPDRLRNSAYDADYLVDGQSITKDEILFFLTREQKRNLIDRGCKIKEIIKEAKKLGYLIKQLDDFSYPREFLKSSLATFAGLPGVIFNSRDVFLGDVFIDAWTEYVNFLPLLAHNKSLNFVYLTFPNGQTALRYNSAIVTGLCRKYGSRSVGFQTRAIHSKNHDYYFDCFDLYLSWGKAWLDLLEEGMLFIEKKAIVGCIYLDSLQADACKLPQKLKNCPSRLNVCVFPQEISGKHHYSRDYALTFMKNCARLAIKHPDITFLVKSKDPKNNAAITSDNEFMGLYSTVKNNFRFLDRPRHEYSDILSSSDIIIAVGFTTPGTEALLLGKRVIYYNELKFGGQAFARIPDLIARDFTELDVLFDKALTDYDEYAGSIKDKLEPLDPYRDGKTRDRINGILCGKIND